MSAGLQLIVSVILLSSSDLRALIGRRKAENLLWAALLAFLYVCGLVACNDVSTTPTTPSTTASGTLSITTTSLPDATVGQAYNFTLSGSGGTPPYNWLVIPALPTGLTLNASTGVISGTPGSGTASTTSHTFILQDSSSKEDTKDLPLTINAAPTPLSITTSSLRNATVNQPYCPLTLTATGGTPPYTWSVSPALPNGLQFNVVSPGTISGVPLADTAGSTTHSFTVLDSTPSTKQTISKSLNLTITATVPTLVITTTSLPNGRVGQAYNQTLQGSGGIPCYTWSVNPALPNGLSLNSTTGAITGTPAPGTVGKVTYTFTLQDSKVPTPQTTSKPLSLEVKS